LGLQSNHEAQAPESQEWNAHAADPVIPDPAHGLGRLVWAGAAWSNSPFGLLAPRLTPFLPFLGIAVIGHSWPYGLVSVVFIFLHTWHGIKNL